MYIHKCISINEPWPWVRLKPILANFDETRKFSRKMPFSYRKFPGPYFPVSCFPARKCATLMKILLFSFQRLTLIFKGLVTNNTPTLFIKILVSKFWHTGNLHSKAKELYFLFSLWRIHREEWSCQWRKSWRRTWMHVCFNIGSICVNSCSLL